MRYWTGAALFMFGAWLIYASFAWRRKVIGVWRQNGILGAITAAGGVEPELSSMAVFGEITRPIILFVLGVIAVKMTIIYIMIDGGEYFSYFDLAGLLFVLASYGNWISQRTKYSLVRFAT